MKEKKKITIRAMRRHEPRPVIVKAGCTPSCPCCESAAWMTNADEEPNTYCGLCGQRLDWANPENPDAEEAEEEEEACNTEEDR